MDARVTAATTAADRVTPLERLAALPPHRQAQLLDPAEEEFAERGFAGASLNRILARAGMSKGQAYYYISGKHDLYRVVVDRALGRLVARLDVSIGRPDGPEEFWTQVREAFTRITEVLLADQRLAALAIGIYESSETRGALAVASASIHDAAGALIDLGQSVRAVRLDLPRSLLLDTLFGMALEFDRWFAAHWREIDDAEAIRLADAMVDMLRAAASPRPAP